MKTIRSGCVGLAVVAFALCHGANAWALKVGAFGDVGALRGEDGTTSFRISHVDLFASTPIDPQTRVLLEVEFRANGEYTHQRYWIAREVTDWLEVGAGRFHAPIGYWSRTYHHGKLLQPTVTRPFVLAFEDSGSPIIPMHVVGAMAKVERGDGFLYEAWVANSNAINSSPAGNHRLEVPDRTDRSNDKSVFAHVAYDRPGFPLKPGVSAMVNHVVESSNGGLVLRGDTLVSQWLVGADLRYEQGPFDLLVEYYRLTNDARPGVGDGATHTAYAGFGQLTYHVTGRWSATYRYEALNYSNQDAYFTHPRLLARDPSVDEKRYVYAIRYDFSETNALKLEASKRPRLSTTDHYTWNLSWEFLVF